MAQAMPRPVGPLPVVNFPSRRPPRWRWIAPGAVFLLFLVLGFLYMTGQLAAAQTLPLSFKSSGKLADLKVSVGQRVKKGNVLAQIEALRYDR